MNNLIHGPRLRALTVPAALVALGFIGRYAVPWPIPRAVLVAPALLWVPGHCLLGALGLRSAAGRWATPLSVLLSMVAVIASSLISYAGFGYVPLGTLPLWVSLGALPLAALRPSPTAASLSRETLSRETLRTLGSGAAFAVGTLAVAGLVAELVHVLPSQPQPGYLAFSFSGDYAAVPGVIKAQAGGVLEVPVSVTGAKEDLSGLTVAIDRDGRPITTTPTVPIQIDGSGQGYARIELPIAAGCLSRYSFTLERDSTSLRLLDLYVTSTSSADCHV